MTASMWMVRAGRGAYKATEFVEKKVVAIGWGELGALSQYKDRDAIISAVAEKYPEQSKKQALFAGSQVYRFVHDIAAGDGVITYDSSARIYWVGTVRSAYRYAPSLIDGLPNVKEVSWEKQIDRDALSVSTRHAVGSIATLFKVREEAAAEIRGLVSGNEVAAPVAEEAEEENLYEDIQGRSVELIKDKLSKLDWDEMQQVVAGVLRAMGYKTRVSPSGSDRGKDIVASPDGLGLEQPRIVVEVKHRQRESIDAPKIRSFLGGRHSQDKGLYVSTGGFTKDALYEAERASIPLTLMDLDDLVQYVTDYYEQLDADTKALVPLKKMYWPA